MDKSWIRIPSPISVEQDSRELCAILASYGLEVRIIREKATKSSTYKRYIEYRDQSYLPENQ